MLDMRRLFNAKELQKIVSPGDTGEDKE